MSRHYTEDSHGLTYRLCADGDGVDGGYFWACLEDYENNSDRFRNVSDALQWANRNMRRIWQSDATTTT